MSLSRAPCGMTRIAGPAFASASSSQSLPWYDELDRRAGRAGSRRPGSGGAASRRTGRQDHARVHPPAERDRGDPFVEIAARSAGSAAARRRHATRTTDHGRDVPGRAPHAITMPARRSPNQIFTWSGVPSPACSASQRCSRRSCSAGFTPVATGPAGGQVLTGTFPGHACAPVSSTCRRASAARGAIRCSTCCTGCPARPRSTSTERSSPSTPTGDCGRTGCGRSSR